MCVDFFYSVIFATRYFNLSIGRRYDHNCRSYNYISIAWMSSASVELSLLYRYDHQRHQDRNSCPYKTFHYCVVFQWCWEDRHKERSPKTWSLCFLWFHLPRDWTNVIIIPTAASGLINLFYHRWWGDFDASNSDIILPQYTRVPRR